MDSQNLGMSTGDCHTLGGCQNPGSQSVNHLFNLYEWNPFEKPSLSSDTVFFRQGPGHTRSYYVMHKYIIIYGCFQK